MPDLATNTDRTSFHLDRKALAIILFVQLLILFITPDLIHNILRDSKLITYLIGANVWALGGLVACTLPTKHDFSYRRRQFWVLFFAPLAGVFIVAFWIENIHETQNLTVPSQTFGGNYFMDATGQLHKIDRNTPYTSRYRTSARATPVFFARYEIPAGAALTIKNVYAAGANINEEEGRIIANSKNYCGENSNPNSILLRRTKRKLQPHESIKNTDVKPPYSEEFVLHETQ